MRAGWRSCARFDCAALPPAPRAPATSPLTPELLAAWPPSLPREFRSVVLALGLASPRLAGASLLITKCRLCQTHYPPPERLRFFGWQVGESLGAPGREFCDPCSQWPRTKN